MQPVRPGVPDSRSPSRSKVALLVAALVGVLLIAAGAAVVVTIVILRGTLFSPTAAVGTYVGDVEAGRFSNAWSVDRDENLPADGSVLGAGTRLASRIRDVTVTDAGVHGGVHAVRVEYAVGSAHGSGTILLRRTGPRFLFFDGWRIVRGLATTAQLSASNGGELRVGGRHVPLHDGAAEVVVYPGAYAMSLARSQWLVSDPQTLVVTGPGTQTNLTVRPTDALRQQVQRSVDARIDACGRSQAAAPDGCPFRVDADGEVRAVSWRISGYPSIVLDGDGEGFGADANGTATAGYETRAVPGGSWQKGTETESFGVFGSIAIDASGVHVELLGG